MLGNMRNEVFYSIMGICLIVIIELLSGCTDARWDQFASLGNRAEVKCYSGERLIFHGFSTGKVINESNSDGYFARWDVIAVDGQWKHIDTTKPVSAGVSGNCTIIYTDE